MAMGLFQILKEAFTAVPTFDDLNDEFYDGLEEALILADVGADTAADTVAQLRKRVSYSITRSSLSSSTGFNLSILIMAEMP